MSKPFVSSSPSQDETLIQKTKEWLQEVVIGLNLCPFAAAPFTKGLIGFSVTDLQALEEQAQKVLENLNEQKFETSLLILNEKISFEDFFDMFGGLEESMEKVDLHQHFQIVAFHPDFVFQGLERDDLANLVNRSPFPMIHFLKTSSFEKLNISVEEGEEISLRNEKHLKSLDQEQLKSLFPWNF